MAKRKPKTVTVNRDNPRGCFQPDAPALKCGEEVTLLRTYWYNGEGWASVRTAAGVALEIPDVFLDGVY